ncbi:unnamed protein product, partial [marine sediment metagenome]
VRMPDLLEGILSSLNNRISQGESSCGGLII